MGMKDDKTTAICYLASYGAMIQYTKRQKSEWIGRGMQYMYGNFLSLLRNIILQMFPIKEGISDFSQNVYVVKTEYHKRSQKYIHDW